MMVLLDTGPIVAVLNRRERHHEESAELIMTTPGSLITCEAVIAEACHLVDHRPAAVADILNEISDGEYHLIYSLEERAKHVAKLMRKYADIPMDLADACLVDMATVCNTGRILTLDRDFRIYRWGRNRPFDLLIDF
jgi:predicted nucleic acid-binding protein